MIISLDINMDLPDAHEVRNEFLHYVERINQEAGNLDNVQKEKMEYLARKFNDGKIALINLREALMFVYREAVTRANLPKERNNG